MTMSDRIVILDQGTIQQVGPPEVIYEQPVNLFVADFIGSPSMNTFEVELDGDTLRGDAFSYELSSEHLERVNKHADDGDELILGIRPEDIEIVDEPGRNAIQAHLDVLEPVGSDNFLYLRLGDEECRVRVPGGVKPTEGEDLTIRFDEGSLHLFRQDTGRNILVDVDEESHTVAASDESVTATGD